MVRLRKNDSLIRKHIPKEKCELCEFNQVLEYHHILPVFHFGEIAKDFNIKVLCPNHHRLVQRITNKFIKGERITALKAIKDKEFKEVMGKFEEGMEYKTVKFLCRDWLIGDLNMNYHLANLVWTDVLNKVDGV